MHVLKYRERPTQQHEFVKKRRILRKKIIKKENFKNGAYSFFMLSKVIVQKFLLTFEENVEINSRTDETALSCSHVPQSLVVFSVGKTHIFRLKKNHKIG